MFKSTKIIATIGPSTDSPEMIKSLINAGVNVFRFNFKHNTVEWHSERIDRVNKIAEEMKMPVGTLIDLQGPEIRINMPGENISLEEGELIHFGESVFKTGEKGFSITHPQIIEHLTHGQQVRADDGYFSFVVVRKDDEVYLQSQTTGVLPKQKTLNIPGAEFPFPVLIERDFEGLKLASLHEIDFIALSFVRTSQDIHVVRNEANKVGLTSKLIAKIETRKAIDHLDAIIDASDGIMVARGDLGVEIPIQEVPLYQKLIIKKCMIKGKFVITATQMLQSMVDNSFPTRAEVSDVANAVYDLTDCIMLSGETANGKYPLKAVEMMADTALFYELKTDEDTQVKIQFSADDTSVMVTDAAYSLYRKYVTANQPVAGFMVFTQSGHTATLLSRYKPKVPIFTFTPNHRVSESLAVNFGVMPVLFGYHNSNEVDVAELKRAIHMLQEQKLIDSHRGKLIVIHGEHWGTGSGATTIRIM